MCVSYDVNCGDIIFRPHRLCYFTALSLLFGIGGGLLALATRHSIIWLLGAALIAYFIVAIVVRYIAGTVIIRGYDLIVRRGTFTTWDVSFPIWKTRPIVTQSLFGRILDYGTLTLLIDDELVVVEVAQLRALQQLICKRRAT